MTQVNIFIASSLEELKEERLELSDYIRKLTDIYKDRGVYFRLYLCEDENIAMANIRKQEEYNRQIRDSQLFFIIFFNRAGQYTLEEFDVAYRHFKETGSPAIITCFRKGEGYAPQQGVLDFMKRLDQELGHYFTMYEQIDSLKLKLLMQVKLMNLDVPVEFVGGKALVGGKEVLTLDQLPLLLKNANYQQLKAEYDACERAFQAAKARYLLDSSDDDGFLAASEKRNKARKALEELENALFSMLTDMEEKSAKGHLTPRQREAYALLEQGNADAASAMLDEDEIEADADRGAALADHGRRIQEQCIQELLSKIEIEKTRVDDPERFDRILRLFEKAVAREEKEHLSKKAMYVYCNYLWKQCDYKRGIHWAERYQNYMELEGTEAEISNACNILGLLYLFTGNIQEAEEEYLRAKKIREKLAKVYPEIYLNDLATTCNGLGNLYNNDKRLQEAETELLNAKKIWEKLSQKNHEAYSDDVAKACHNLGVLYGNTMRLREAEMEYRHAKEISEKLVNDNPRTNQCNLATTCNNLGNLYYATGRMQEARSELLRAMQIQEKLSEENPNAYLPNLAVICANLGNLYSDTRHMAEAKNQYLRAKEILEKLAKENPEAYLSTLAVTCYNLAILYEKMRYIREAETEWIQAKKIWMRLAEENPRTYLQKLIIVCRNLQALNQNNRKDVALATEIKGLEEKLRSLQ